MENVLHLTEVQTLNLNFLLTIQACLKQDRLAASYRFHLDAECAAMLDEMSVSDLVALAQNMPHESLFQPIGNLRTLLAAPCGLVVTLCTVGMDQSHAKPLQAVAATKSA